MEEKDKSSRQSSDRREGVRRAASDSGTVKASAGTAAGRAVRSQVSDRQRNGSVSENTRRRRPESETARRRRPEGEAVRKSRPEGEAVRKSRPEGEAVRKKKAASGTVRRRPEGETAGRRPEGEAARRRRPEGETVRKSRAASGNVRRPVSENTGNRRPVARKPQSKRKRKRNLGLKIFLLIILIIAAVAAAFLWKKYGPSKEPADLKEYYGIENENQLAVIINNQITEPHAKIEDGKAYVQYEIVRDFINNRFYWDPNENIMLYTLPNDTVSVEVGSKDYTVSKEKNSEDYVILKTEGNTAYIALEFIQKYTDIEYEVYDNPGRVMIVSDWGETTVAEVKRDTQVRYRGGVKSPVLTEISKKDEVTIIESEANWKKVRTKDGFIGYVKSNALKKEEMRVVDREFAEQEYTSIKKDYTINMAWHNVTNSTANNSVLQRLAQSKGLTTIVPTWFHVKDIEGNLDSIASSEYVNYAHQAQVEVWAAIRDFDGGISSNEESFELLSHTSRRENLINQLIAQALQVGIDGINVDFEKISEQCGEHYIQFIRELSVRCRQNNLVLSVDNYVPKGYNMQYNRKEQGIVADYVIIMGYDEHYGGSPVAGPVSSYNFVKEGIEETLKEVPAEKVISGIPFFTRLWSETPKTQAEIDADAGTDAAEYSMKVSSEPLGMSAAKERIAQAGAQITVDSEAQQNYAEWSADNVTYKIWIEDEQSIEPKLKLMKDYKLAGTAAWAIGQESPEIWQLIQKYTN